MGQLIFPEPFCGGHQSGDLRIRQEQGSIGTEVSVARVRTAHRHRQTNANRERSGVPEIAGPVHSPTVVVA